MKTRVAIVGGGISGLAAALWLDHDHCITDIVVLEAETRPGGKVWTDVEDGHTLEWGPQGFLDNAPGTLELAALVGVDGDLVRADSASSARFILRAGRLRSVPLSPPAFLASDVLPLAARLRVLGESLARRRPDGDETVFDFAARRIGRRAAEVLVDAMVTGVFAGDSRRLSLAATFPRMAAMEAEYGSLTRAMLAKARAARRAGTRSGGPAGPGGTLTTFRGGMGQLPQAAARRLGDRVLLGAPVAAIRSADGGFRLQAAGFEVEAEAVLLALPAPDAARLLGPLAPRAVPALQAIPFAPIAVVMAAYPTRDAFGGPVEGFGFLVPSGERVGVLGTLYCHSIFPGQAPPGKVLLRAMLGGARDPDVLAADDGTIIGRVRDALHRVLGRDPEPDRTWVVRHREAIAQYTVGHLDRVETAEGAAAAAGVELTGSSLRGVSVNDCVARARLAAERVAARLGARPATVSR